MGAKRKGDEVSEVEIMRRIDGIVVNVIVGLALAFLGYAGYFYWSALP